MTYTLCPLVVITRNVFKKTNVVGLKRGKITQGYVRVHKSYTDDRNLRMIIVKDQ